MTRARTGLWCALAALVGCAGPQIDPTNANGGVTATTRDLGVTHTPKSPPVGTGGGPTAAGCNGVTEKGRCELTDKGQLAVTCDVSANSVRRFDCTAMQKVCVIDSARGAICVNLPSPTGDPGSKPQDMAQAPSSTDMARPPRDMAQPPAPRDMATSPARDMAMPPAPMCASGVTYRGYCASATGTGAADTAIWCDPSTGQTLVVSCAARGQTCAIDGCADGAYCCDGAAAPDMAMAPAQSAQCTMLGYAGTCAAQHARWCSGGQLFDIDCGARGQACMVDTCAQGAYCCDAPVAAAPDMAQPPSTASECARLGLAG